MVKFLQRNAVRKLLGKFHFISISKNQTQREIKKKKKKNVNFVNKFYQFSHIFKISLIPKTSNSTYKYNNFQQSNHLNTT